MDDPFRLTKWYLDCLEPGGRTAIAYWAACSWRGIEVTWHNVTVYQSDGGRYERSSHRRVLPPAVSDGVLRWASPRLQCSTRCTPRAGSFASRLLTTPHGAVDWRCEVPAAETEMTYPGGPPLHGPGYAECLTISLPPWRLPITGLLWGRWISTDLASSVVWIRWSGPRPLTLMLLNGCREPSARVGERCVAAGSAALRLEDSRVLRGRSPRAILGRLGPLSTMIPRSVLGLGQTRWRSRGTLERADGSSACGWAIHEQVRLP